MIRRFGFVIVIVVIAIGALVFRDRLSSNASDLKVGDCFDEPNAIGQTVSDVQHHPCNETHTAEVFAVSTNPAASGAAYPDQPTRQAYVAQVCDQPFTDYVGSTFAESNLDLHYFAPTEDGWNGGDRLFTCYVTHPDGSPFTASVKGTKQ
jgi:Septum formation